MARKKKTMDGYNEVDKVSYEFTEGADIYPIKHS